VRAAIYARYSTDLQSQASITDQVELCRRYIEARGWTLVHSFADRAVSGASTVQRPSFQDMVRAVERSEIDVIVTEALDRIGRNLADVATLHDRLEFRRVALHTVSAGPITTMHVGLLGTMAQLFLSDLKQKTKRGLIGRIRAGKSAGSKAFGYDVVGEGSARQAGERTINEPEAAVVRRIFRLFAGGESARAIAQRLNREGIKGPGGRAWCDTAIRGQRDRGTGLLNNEIYRGMLIWNRCSYVKDPRTGKRLARPNPSDAWESVEAPQLRIVDEDLWIRAKARQAETGFAVTRDGAGNALNRTHRRKFLLSGLLTCGSCGAGYTMVSATQYGCAARRQKGTCTNDRLLPRADIEGRVLAALKTKLVTPDLVKAFTDAYVAETNRLAHDQVRAQAEWARESIEVNRRLKTVLDAIEEGRYSRELRERLDELEQRKDELRRMAAEQAKVASPVRLHPNLADLYARKVDDLERMIADNEHKAEAMTLIRSLVERIVLTPEDGELRADLHGDLARILSICEGAGVAQGGAKAGDATSSSPTSKWPERKVPGHQLSVGAGTGFEPVTFRL
jgi:site-specific DNA recombinase